MKCYGLGNLTRDPELRYMPNGAPVCNVSLAMNRKYKDKEGNPQEQTDFVELEIYGRTAENTNKYCQKGRQVFVEGRLRLHKWEAQDGTKRSKHTVVVERIQFLQRPQGDTRGKEPQEAAAPAAGNDDDVPF